MTAIALVTVVTRKESNSNLLGTVTLETVTDGCTIEVHTVCRDTNLSGIYFTVTKLTNVNWRKADLAYR